MKIPIIKIEPYIVHLAGRTGRLGTLACGHKQTVRENQKAATCRQCERQREPRKASGAPDPERIIFYEGSKPVAEVNVAGWTIREVVELMRIQRLNGRTGKYYRV